MEDKIKFELELKKYQSKKYQEAIFTNFVYLLEEKITNLYLEILIFLELLR